MSKPLLYSIGFNVTKNWVCAIIRTQYLRQRNISLP